MAGLPYPYVEFALAIGVWEIVDAALPDTGYDGEVIVPFRVGREIVVAGRKERIAIADGSVHEVETWTGTLSIADQLFPVNVRAFGSEFIIGRGVLDQLEICFEFGERVRLRFEREEGE